MAYFYFDFNDTAKQQYRNLVCSLITQFSTQCKATPEALETLYSQSQNGQWQSTIKNLMVALQHILDCFQHVYIILDALDECVERAELLRMIAEIMDWRLDTCHILATSRREREIEDCLQALVSCQINIQSELVAGDIQVHIYDRLQNNPKLKKWPAEIQKEIEITLMKGAHGM
jgi:hypothetical protein